MKIAVVGSGIAGLTAAWRLDKEHDVTLFEAADYVGGHTATVDVEWAGKSYAVDTGFIVFNDWTYPNFIALLDELGVEWQYSNMSFSLSCERTGLEYNGTSLNSLFAQRRNLANPRFLRMLTDILRFNREAKAFAAEPPEDAEADQRYTLSAFLKGGGYSPQFVEQYILPMGRAIWSAEQQAMLQFPARFFIDFFARHGFLNISDRPVWRTVRGGSREYVRRMLSKLRATVRVSTPVAGIRRLPHQVQVRTATGTLESFDHVFIASHADQALKMLDDATPAEREVLGSFPFAANETVLHTDESVLPKRPLARAAWNYHLLSQPQEPVALTYDMNVLQNIEAPVKFLVTLNHTRAIDERKILRRFMYHHPVYLPQGVAAQARHREINGARRTYFCGAYWRCGFHEDGVVSGQTAVAHFQADQREELPLQRLG